MLQQPTLTLFQFRTVANAIRAGIAVDRIYRSICAATLFEIPSDVARLLKVNKTDWRPLELHASDSA